MCGAGFSVMQATIVYRSAPVEMRGLSMFPPRVLLVGASTGGPQALMTLVGAEWGYRRVKGLA